jgi:hypothetical protein
MAKPTVQDKAARLRRKLVMNEMNPVIDVFLSLLIVILSPFIALSAFFHDKLMYKFLNRTYIYNVSWVRTFFRLHLIFSCIKSAS